MFAALTIAATDVAKVVIAPEDAEKHVGKSEVTIRFTVAQAKNRLEKRGIIYLDSKEDFMDPQNLGVALSAVVAADLHDEGIDDVAEYLKGKEIEVTGCPMRFEERLYVPVLDRDQLVVVKPAP
jgi:hypothetical protein